MRLAFVIQRYGLEVNGGAELHCRWLAERLARRHQVEVFATRALDYLEWRNHYPKGTELVNGIPVHRSTVKRTRNARAFASLSNICFHEAHTREEEEAWVRENGPYSPELVKAVTAARARFDRVFFYCYRYYHSYHGVPAAAERAILVPTAEEDPAIRLEIMKPLFRAPRGLVYLTPEEQALVEDASGNASLPSVVIGSGINLPEADPALDFRRKHGLERPFVLYVGRIDRNKGALTLFAYFKKFLEEQRADVDLVLAGKPAVPIPDHPRIRHVGFISEEEKVAALRQCRLLVMPSPYESLSVIVLEAWKLGVPVLANARCKVLAGQCLRSNGGLFYHGYAEFAEGLRLLLEQNELAASLGRQGQAYVEREYSWETIDAKLDDLIARTASSEMEVPGARAAGR
ncbi:MAG TPA: glycosyltransferase family 4 protein [Vicinamibacteria bacterium]|nr:glycosyltransferase family 4 protein [Vicinamibacteria bacterium]